MLSIVPDEKAVASMERGGYMSTFHEPDFPAPLLICHRCRLVHDETGGWMSKQTYRETTGIDPLTCRLIHTYCPFCFDFLLNRSQAA
jgi:hypothetical protein